MNEDEPVIQVAAQEEMDRPVVATHDRTFIVCGDHPARTHRLLSLLNFSEEDIKILLASDDIHETVGRTMLHYPEYLATDLVSKEPPPGPKLLKAGVDMSKRENRIKYRKAGRK